MSDSRTAREISLAGIWNYRLDRDARGMQERWYEEPMQASGTVSFPGTLTTNGIGDPVSLETDWTGLMSVEETYLDPKWKRLSGDRYKPPYWLSPETFYSGVAWYQREIDLPDEWADLTVAVELERPHWESSLWVDGIALGSSRALSTPHRFRLPVGLTPGRHLLTIRMDNSYLVKIGAQAHSITDNTSGNWNGVVGRLTLHAEPRVRVAAVVVVPEPERQRVVLHVSLSNATETQWAGEIAAEAGSFNAARRHEMGGARTAITVEPGESTVDLELDTTGDVLTWSEWAPALYELRLVLLPSDRNNERVKPADEYRTTFGVRRLSVDGTRFKVNGQPMFLRGTLECNIFPREGHTATSEEAWEYVYTRGREYGFNHFRFHSWCPPEAAFTVADRMGIYLQIETCCWAAHETKIGDGLSVDRFVFEESERIVADYGNHPSFCFLNYGNEGDGEHNAAFLTTFVEHWKAKDQRRLYTSSSGWPQSPASDYHSALQARAQKYGKDGTSHYYLNEHPPATDFDFCDDVDRYDRPLVSHEPGMWGVYPNFDEIEKYTGAYKARNFELFRSELEEHHMLDQWRDFVMASGKLQTLCYKAEIEAMLRTKGLAGFQLLSLMDFPGQGTAIMAPVDVFYEEKGYTSAAEWRRFLGETVVLARIPSLILDPTQVLVARLETFHLGSRPLRERRMVWTVTDDLGTVVRSGTLGPHDVPVADATAFDELIVPLERFVAPARYTLAVTLTGTTATNEWEFFLFPTRVPDVDAASIYETNVFDARAREILHGGGTVLLNTCGQLHAGRSVRTGFTPVHWNTLCAPAQPVHTMGLLCDPRHPVFSSFPTQFHTNYQWWDMLTQGEAQILDGAPPALRPIVQMIDSYHSNRRLGLVTEMRALGGRLVLNGIDLDTDLDSRPGARQFKASLLDYLQTESFEPQVEVDASFLESLYE